MYGPVSGGRRTETAIVFDWLEPRTTKFCEMENEMVMKKCLKKHKKKKWWRKKWIDDY